MTTQVQKAEGYRPKTSSEQGTIPIPATVLASPPAQPAEEPDVYWGDWIALRVWGSCFFVLGIMLVFDFLAGIWAR